MTQNMQMTSVNKTFDTVVVGLGKTGFSCAKYLAKQGCDFAVTDMLEEPAMLDKMQQYLPHVPLYLGGTPDALLLKTNTILLSPGVSAQQNVIAQAINAGVEVYSDVELFCRNTSTPIIAITGSNGKSTVTALVAEMLQNAHFNVAVGGNFGTPVLDFLYDKKTADVYVLELSSFQLETVRSLNAHAAVILNISPDHMDRYENLSEYILAKQNIYHGAKNTVINLDDEVVANMRPHEQSYVGITLATPDNDEYGLRQYDGVRWIVKGTEKLIPVDSLYCNTQHNIFNAMAAIALADLVACPRPVIFDTLQTFIGLKHRCQKIFEHNNIVWINDSKGTNVAASCAAIEGFANQKNIILIAGGCSKGEDFIALQACAKNHLKAAIVLGQDGYKIKKVLTDITPVYEVDSLDEAVEIAANISTDGDTVLLSPACSSHDMFADYQVRGQCFIDAIQRFFKIPSHV